MEANTRMPAERIHPHWWSLSAPEILQLLQVDPDQGLSSDQVRINLEKYGGNRFEDIGPTSLWTLLLESAKSPMMVLLFTIAGISLALGQYRESAVMVFVVAMYIGIHLLNKARSDRTMARLREVQAPRTHVLRNGELNEIRVEDVVVGDILPLQSGSRVPADARLISAVGLLVNEALLTGEATPVNKHAEAEVQDKALLAERETAVFTGTTILDGQGRAVVTAVGRASELGKIAELSTKHGAEPTPLQQEMSNLARTLAFIAIGVSMLIPVVGLLRGFNLQQMVLTWLSFTFLMVPGQPPIIIAMALALASLELTRKQVIVRQLHGAETLGSVNVVLSDKTGTMTRNQMRLSAILLPDGSTIEMDNQAAENQQALCQFFEISRQSIPDQSRNPTDLAVVQAARLVENFNQPVSGQLIGQTGFSSSGDYRSLTYIQDGINYIYYTGRPEYLIERSNRIISSRTNASGVADWSDADKARLKQKLLGLASQGNRVSAYAYRQGQTPNSEPSGLVFAGAAVISDPVRPEVKDAIHQLTAAGVRTVMVTGDIPETAGSVARQVGIKDRNVLTGRDMENKSETELQKLVGDVDIFARTTPEQKLQLVQAFQSLNQTVAVTGDGINDAPALSTAHIGIAMGEHGTDVAKEAADLILTDDNFAHLPDGIAIGRKAYDNFRKGITYYLSAKAILLTIFIIPLLVGVQFPLAPIQIIFTELLMDLASSTIFVTESAEPDIMKRKPRPRGPFLSSQVAWRILRNMTGLVTGILAVYFGSLALGYGIDSARTAAFSTWLIGHIILALNLKQEKVPLFKQGLFSNHFAAGWLAGMVFLVLAMTFLSPVQSILHTTALSGLQWIMVVAGSLLASMWIELKKWLQKEPVSA